MPRDPPDADDPRPLADPVAEARRLIHAARDRGIELRALGGAAVRLQARADGPLPVRDLKDLDLVTARGRGRAVMDLLPGLGYQGDEMFNAVRGARRQVHFDPVNRRGVDVFVGEFSMCHQIAVADRLERDDYTVPLAELLLTKLQIIELNERDEHDIYTICYHHDVTVDAGIGIEADVIAEACGDDWGLWRTCRGTIERSVADIDRYDLSPEAAALIAGRLAAIWDHVEARPKTGRWRRRARIGDRKRWYEEPEEP